MLHLFTIIIKRSCSVYFTIFLTTEYSFCRTPYETQQEYCRMLFAEYCSKHPSILNFMLLPQII